MLSIDLRASHGVRALWWWPYVFTWPTPMTNSKGWPLSLEESNFVPLVRVPAAGTDNDRTHVTTGQGRRLCPKQDLVP